MRTHRIIFWTTLLLFVIGFPTILSINFDVDIKNILIGIICSSLVAAIVELPNLINYKSSIKSNLYDSLLYSKMFLLQYNNNINKRLKDKDFKYVNYGAYYLNSISNYINLYNQTDNTIFIEYGSKKKDFLKSKKDFYNLYNFVNNETLLLEISRIKVELKEYTINDVYNQLKSVKNANNNLITEIDKVAKKLLSKKYLKYYEDNSIRIINTLKNAAIK